MHQRKIVHRDLKLENVLLNSKENETLDVRLADFGISSFVPNDDFLFKKCGTPSYIAPEILRGLGYDSKADIFSLGSMMFNLMSGRFLFYSDNIDEILRLNRQCEVKEVLATIKGKISSFGMDILKKLLQVDP